MGTGLIATAQAAHSPGPDPEVVQDMEFVVVPVLMLLEPQTSPGPVPVN